MWLDMPCPECGGTGEVVVDVQHGFLQPDEPVWGDCPSCGGSGEAEDAGWPVIAAADPAQTDLLAEQESGAPWGSAPEHTRATGRRSPDVPARGPAGH